MLVSVIIGGVIYAVGVEKEKINFGEIVLSDIPEKKDGSVRVMSFNLRYKDDEEGSVINRSQISTAIISRYSPDSFGVQEATLKWLRILDKAVGDKYARVGEPRDKKGPFSEYSAVFYLKDKLIFLTAVQSGFQKPLKRNILAVLVQFVFVLQHGQCWKIKKQA